MNEDRMLELADTIERTGRFDLHVFRAERLELDNGSVEYTEQAVGHGDLLHQCNTVGCVAGWAAALAVQYDPTLAHEGTEDIARHWLQLHGTARNIWSRLFSWGPKSVWYAVADEFGWEKASDSEDGLANPSEISAAQAAEILRRIAHGTIVL